MRSDPDRFEMKGDSRDEHDVESYNEGDVPPTPAQLPLWIVPPHRRLHDAHQPEFDPHRGMVGDRKNEDRHCHANQPREDREGVRTGVVGGRDVGEVALDLDHDLERHVLQQRSAAQGRDPSVSAAGRVREQAADPGALANTSTLRFNEFFPWEINEDGTREETLNHVGRHELGGSSTFPVFLDDPNLTDQRVDEDHANRLFLNDDGLYHFREDPRAPGTFFATKSPEFGTPNAGTLVKLTVAGACATPTQRGCCRGGSPDGAGWPAVPSL